jgi:hypothetical protein
MLYVNQNRLSWSSFLEMEWESIKMSKQNLYWKIVFLRDE